MMTIINDVERKRLVDDDIEIPIAELSHYETDYMINGKLIALMNPHLLSFLKEFIEKDRTQPRKAAGLCINFYGTLLPAMKISDYVTLITYLWPYSRKVKSGGKKNKMKVSFPDGTSEVYTIFEGLKAIVLFYGEENVRQKKLKIRQDDFIVTHLPYGKENVYEEISSGYYMNVNGNTKDRMNICNTINAMFGRKITFGLI